MDKFLRGFITVWVGLIILLNLVAVAAMFYVHGMWGGFDEVRRIYSPFNIVNYIAQVISLSPALLAFWVLERRQKRQIDEV